MDGILPVNKPEGVSSAAVVARVKKTLKVKKAGHTGTLDPFATGLLLIAIGKATRISRFFLGGSKQYLAQVTLGVETDTLDCTGNVTKEAGKEALSPISPKDVAETVAGFSGVQEQVAPSFSALKHNGKPLYQLARQGTYIEKPPRSIEIFDIRVTGMDLPRFDIVVHCSGGTYIRSLARDIGQQLTCGAHLSGLTRTRSGRFSLEQALDLDALEKMDPASIADGIVPMADCLDFMPTALAGKEMAGKIAHGQKLAIADLDFETGAVQNASDPVRILDENKRLLAVVEPDKSGRFYNYCCVFPV